MRVEQNRKRQFVSLSGAKVPFQSTGKVLENTSECQISKHYALDAF